MIHERMFPIQGEHETYYNKDGSIREHTTRPAGQVPWGVAEEAYKVYARKYGSSQSLQRLADRGGFGWSELIWLLRGLDPDGIIKISESIAPKEQT